MKFKWYVGRGFSFNLLGLLHGLAALALVYFGHPYLGVILALIQITFKED